MSFWQFNAYCEAFQDRQIDSLSLQIQAAYYNAYWNSAAKHKKSLMSVLKSLRNKSNSNKTKKREPIDVESVSRKFRQMEELKEYGWTKE